PEEQRKLTAGHVHKAARRMEQLLSEIGQVARSEPGRRVSCTADELVHAAVESQKEKARQKNVSIRQSVAEGLKVWCEKSRVERVLINLIGNSLEVLPDGGEIAIEGSRAGESVVIEVSDNGPGVPAEIRGRLFQPFVTSGKRNGLGLGLALARQTMLDHGGILIRDVLTHDEYDGAARIGCPTRELLCPTDVDGAAQLSELAHVVAMAYQGIEHTEVFVGWVADSIHDSRMPHGNPRGPV